MALRSQLFDAQSRTQALESENRELKRQRKVLKRTVLEQRKQGGLRSSTSSEALTASAGTDPGATTEAIAVGEALQRFRSNLGHYWPAADSFRIGSDPWPAIEQQLMSTEQAVELAIHEANGQIFTARCDLAWRVYYYGDPSAALAVLEEIEPVTAAQAQELEGHRRCLRAARLVELALLKAIANHGDLVVFRAGTLSPYSVRVKPSGETTELYGAASDQVEVRLRFTEVRIGHLLENGQRIVMKPSVA